VTCNKFHTEDQQILGAAVTNLVATAIRCPGFADPLCYVFRLAVIRIFIFIHSFSLFSVFRQVHTFFQSDFSTQCDLALSISVSSILSFPSFHPVAAHVFFLVFPFLLPFPVSLLP